MPELLAQTPPDAAAGARVGSAELASLIEQIEAGVLRRDRDDAPPYPEFALIKQARVGALRLPEPRGAGATLTELFEVLKADHEIDVRKLLRQAKRHELWRDRETARHQAEVMQAFSDGYRAAAEGEDL